MADSIVKFDSKAMTKYVNEMNKKARELAKSKKLGSMYSVIVFKDIQHHFKKQMGPDGKWAKLSTRYKKSRFKKGYTGPILQRTGILRQGFLPTNYRLTIRGYEWYNPVPYAKKHDEGLEGMPKRNFMWLSDKASNDLGKVTLFWITGKK